MNEQSESAFFPVPVRWFEIPMNTARWGFMRLADVAESRSELPKSRRVESPNPTTFAPSPEPSAHVGQILNEHA